MSRPAWVEPFLTELRRRARRGEVECVALAADLAGVSHSYVIRYRKRDPDFRREFSVILLQASQMARVVAERERKRALYREQNPPGSAWY